MRFALWHDRGKGYSRASRSPVDGHATARW